MAEKPQISKSLFGEQVKPEEPEKKMKTSQPGLFDYVNMIFQNPQKFSNLMPYEKGKNMFMLNRFFAINYPIQAQMLNHVKINGAEACQYWCDTLSRIYNRTPGWIYSTLKGTKKAKQEKKKELVVDETTISEYCKRTMRARKDIEDAMKFFPEDMTQELVEFEQMLKGSTLKK